MSSPTDSGMAVRASIARVVGPLALLLIAGLVGLFVWQAGVLAPPAPTDIELSEPVSKPDQITAENASIKGRDKNSLSYEINAASGEQDKLKEDLVHMQQVTSNFERSSGATLNVSSANGLYDRSSKDLVLTGDVQIRDGTRFTARMDKALINTDNQSLTSQSPVKVDMQGSMIEADSLTVSGNGTRILFKGGVKARFNTTVQKTGDGE